VGAPVPKLKPDWQIGLIQSTPTLNLKKKIKTKNTFSAGLQRGCQNQQV